MREREDKPAEHGTAHSQIIDMYFEQQCVENEGGEGKAAAVEEDEDDEFL